MDLGFFFLRFGKTTSAARAETGTRDFDARIAYVACASPRQPALPAEETKREIPRVSGGQRRVAARRRNYGR